MAEGQRYTKKSTLLVRNCSIAIINAVTLHGAECGLLGEAARFALTGEGPKETGVDVLVQVRTSKDEEYAILPHHICATDSRFTFRNDNSWLFYTDASDTFSSKTPLDKKTCQIRLFRHKDLFKSSGLSSNGNHIVSGMRVAPLSAVLIHMLSAWAESTRGNSAEARAQGSYLERLFSAFEKQCPDVDRSQEDLLPVRHAQLKYLVREFFLVQRNRRLINAYARIGLLDQETLREIMKSPIKDAPEPMESVHQFTAPVSTNHQHSQQVMPQRLVTDASRNGTAPPRPRYNLRQRGGPVDFLRVRAEARDAVAAGSSQSHVQSQPQSHVQSQSHAQSQSQSHPQLQLQSQSSSRPQPPRPQALSRQYKRPRAVPFVTEAAVATVRVLQSHGYRAAVFGSLACYLYGANRMPGDADILVFPPEDPNSNADEIGDGEALPERIKRLLVESAPDRFYLKDSINPDATYKVLWANLGDAVGKSRPVETKGGRDDDEPEDGEGDEDPAEDENTQGVDEDKDTADGLDIQTEKLAIAGNNDENPNGTRSADMEDNGEERSKADHDVMISQENHARPRRRGLEDDPKPGEGQQKIQEDVNLQHTNGTRPKDENRSRAQAQDAQGRGNDASSTRENAGQRKHKKNKPRKPKARRRCKVDILVPGIMHLPSVHPNQIASLPISEAPLPGSPQIDHLPLIPFHLLLLQKLQGWADHKEAEEQHKRDKVDVDVRDIRVLLNLRPHAAELKKHCYRYINARPGVRRTLVWDDKSLFSEEFMQLSRERVKQICREHTGMKMDWKQLGFVVEEELQQSVPVFVQDEILATGSI